MNEGIVYVLRCADRKLYIGSTRDIKSRIKAHNAGRVTSTKNRRPIELVYSEKMLSYSDARKRELYFKSGSGREWLQKKLEEWPSGRWRRS